MSFLLDTCVISELRRPSPESAVTDWLAACDEALLYLSVVTLEELKYGIEMLPEGKPRGDLLVWFDDVRLSYRGSILDVSADIAVRWGEIRARLRREGRQLPVVNGLLAATAIQHDLTLVTRNIADFQTTGAELLNPWGR